jgi:hypothetical protein
MAWLALAPGDARAQTYCPTTPVNYNAYGCNSVCSYSSGDWTCDVSSSEDSAMITAVVDFSAAAEYEAWGWYWYLDDQQDKQKQYFCCYEDQTIDNVILNGSTYADTLSFTWDSLTYNLGPYLGNPVTGWAYGNTGNDTIKGSDLASNYSEYLYGEGGGDTIQCYGGDDHAYGGADDDVIFGGSGGDHLEGEDGDDTVLGGTGDDTLYGDSSSSPTPSGYDVLAGGDGDDDMYGGPLGDAMCGDGGTGDYLEDGPSDTTSDTPPDKLWGNSAGDSLSCTNSGTLTDSTSSATGPCTRTLTSKPGACP